VIVEFPVARGSYVGLTTSMESILKSLVSGRSDHKNRCKMLRDAFEALEETYSQLLTSWGLRIYPGKLKITNCEDTVGLSVTWHTADAKTYGYDSGCWRVETNQFWAGIRNTECSPRLLGESGLTSTFKSKDFELRHTGSVIDFVNSYVLALMMELDLVAEDAT
jgi:hypothetical protein